MSTTQGDAGEEALAVVRQGARALRGELAGLTGELQALAAGGVGGSQLAAALRHAAQMERLLDGMEVEATSTRVVLGTAEGLLDGRRILIVDGAPGLLRQLAALFGGAGAVIVTSRNGADAAELLVAGLFDLLVTDAALPDLSGAELIEVLRAQPGKRGRTPAMAMTSDMSVQSYDALIAAGATRVVPKPLPEAAEILRIVGRLVQAQDAPAAPASVEDVPLFDPGPLTRLCQLAGAHAAREILDRLMLDLIETLADIDRIGPALASGGTDAELAELRATAQVLVALAGTSGAMLLLRRAQALDYRLQTEVAKGAPPDVSALLPDIRMLTRGAVAAIARLPLPAPDEGTAQ